LDRILDLIFPDNIYCVCCGDLINKSRYHGLCDKCIEHISWNTQNQFRIVIDDFAFDDVLSCCIYNSYARAIVYKMKMQGHPYIARFLAKLLAERIDLARKEDDLKVDFLVPVPSSKKKIRQRGFNQAQLLSDYTSSLTNIPARNFLIKTKNTKQSKTLSGVERHFANQGVFELDESLMKNISNMNILIVDDVITTGSTADECARMLKNAGANWVGVLCFASCSEGSFLV